jgi:hypothetical protein
VPQADPPYIAMIFAGIAVPPARRKHDTDACTDACRNVV